MKTSKNKKSSKALNPKDCYKVIGIDVEGYAIILVPGYNAITRKLVALVPARGAKVL
jgi:hypothetical protein